MLPELRGPGHRRSLFIVLWACLLGIYTLLLRPLWTDEKDTALWIFFAFGVLFTMFVAGAVGMNQVEEALKARRRRTPRMRVAARRDSARPAP